MVASKNGRKETLVPGDMDRLTEILLLDPFVSFAEAQLILNTELAVRADTGKVIRGDRPVPAPCAC